MKRKWIAVLLCMATAFQSLPASAAEGNTGDTEQAEVTTEQGETGTTDEDYEVLGTDIDSVFESMRDSMMNGEEISISDAFNELSTQKVSQENAFDMSDMTLSDSFDSGLVNIQYQQLTDKMMESSTLLNAGGQSLNCMALFQNTYGDVLSEIALEEPTIPEGFTVSAMLQAGQDAVNEAYADVTSSGDFAVVKNSISIGNIFSIAEQGLSMPDLASGETMSGMLSSLSEGNRSVINRENLQAESALSEAAGDFKQDMVANTKEDLLSMADIINKSAIFPKEGEKQLGNVAYHLDSLIAARRNNSTLGKAAKSIRVAGNALAEGVGKIAETVKEGFVIISEWWDGLWD